jgi:hypothetical protein
MGYFHWTDEETYKNITHTGNLFERVMSWIFSIEPEDLVPGSGNDYYGEGVYFTDYGPDYARSTIAGACFGNSQSQDQVECYFEIEFHGNTKIEQKNDHTWKLFPKSTAMQHIVDHGYHPEFEADDDDWVPSCNKCEDADDVTGPDDDDEYHCSHCEHYIDSDGDCVTDPCSTCDDDDGSSGGGGRQVEVTIVKGNFAPNPSDTRIDSREDLERFAEKHGAIITGKGYDMCSCGEHTAAKACTRGLCGNCCDGTDCDRHS